MRRVILVLFVLALLTIVADIAAVADDAYIIPEQLQRLAAEQHVAVRLGIKWGEANLTDVGRYMSTLAAADVVARTISAKNGRKAPIRIDYLSALMATCNWPPNKPPVITSKDRELLYPAFYSEKLQTILPNAVGETALKFPSLIEGKTPEDIDKTVEEIVPKDRLKYFSLILNVDMLHR